MKTGIFIPVFFFAFFHSVEGAAPPGGRLNVHLFTIL